MSLDSVFSDDWPEDHRSGIVAVVGRPNVGKSTLINAILGQKIAITTPKPQTTRRNQLGIYTEDRGQILFVDTPGLHKPRSKLGDFMTETAERALNDADVILWILDGSEAPQRADQHIAETIKAHRRKAPLWIVVNKTDRVKTIDETYRAQYAALAEHERLFTVSALHREGVQEVTQAVLDGLPEGPRYYPAEQVSDQNMRFIAAEVIREQVILLTEEEIPHSVAVMLTDYEEQDNITNIYAVIYVERDSQKGIIIGKGGAMIKRIGSDAREALETLLDGRVFLDLHVKVAKNWRSDPQFMRRIGYFIPKDED